jgi:hypothetical protein
MRVANPGKDFRKAQQFIVARCRTGCVHARIVQKVVCVIIPFSPVGGHFPPRAVVVGAFSRNRQKGFLKPDPRSFTVDSNKNPCGRAVS